MGSGMRPEVSAAVSAGIAAVAAAALAWGVMTMRAIDGETPFTAAAVAGGGLGLFFGLIFVANFVWAARKSAALRRGEGVIGRWTVSPATLEAFREDDKRRAADGDPNDWNAPRRPPAEGLEVIFSPDLVLIGHSFFNLASTGVQHVRSVEVMPDNPRSLRFTTAVTARQGRGGLGTRFGALRVPVATGADDELARVLAHYQAVLAGERLVRPEFWQGRIRIGLWGAAVCAAIAAGGFALEALEIELGVVPLVMAVVGTILAIGGLLMALIGWKSADRQRRGW